MNPVLLEQSHELREVRLYGHLAKQFGKVHMLSVRSCREAVQALSMVVSGFESALLGHEAGYNVFAGRRARDGAVTEDRLDAPVGKGEAICIVPVIAGAKKGGLFPILLGIALIALLPGAGALIVGGGGSALSGAGMIAKIGFGLILGGLARSLAPHQKGGSGSNAQNEPSYHFNTPANTSTQGAGVPVVYGRMITGSVVISQGLSAEEYVASSTTPADNSTSILPTTWMPKYVYRG